MLRNTFCHVPGLGLATERSLWSQGSRTWTDFLAAPESFSVGSASRSLAVSVLEGSVKAADQLDGAFFADALSANEVWRVWPEFRRKAVYLDIETDGRNGGDAITMVGLFDGDQFQCLIKGIDLDTFPEVIARYDMVVTFFGLGFDVPMLKRAFPQARIPRLHLDLCYALKRVGVRGGLKKIEKQLGLSRGDDVDGLSGLDAIRLWREYQRGRDGSLRTLVEYNREDVVNLEHLAQVTYDRSKEMLLADLGLVL